MIVKEIFTFQDSVTTAGVGNEYSPITGDIISIFITGTSTSRTILFEGCDSEGNWFQTDGLKSSGSIVSSQTSGTGESWIFDGLNFVKYRMNVTAISGGTVRITARIVNSAI